MTNETEKAPTLDQLLDELTDKVINDKEVEDAMNSIVNEIMDDEELDEELNDLLRKASIQVLKRLDTLSDEELLEELDKHRNGPIERAVRGE